MAGDWIKWQKGLSRKPEIVRMAATLSLSRHHVAGLCMDFWEWCDSEIAESSFTSTGSAFVTLSPTDGDNIAFVDALVGTVKFANALAAVEWIRFRDGRIELPGFALHNGETAKTRARNAKNQKNKRDSEDKTEAQPKTPSKRTRVTTKSPPDGDKTVTREREREEGISSIEEIPPPNPPAGEIAGCELNLEVIGESHPNVTCIKIGNELVSFDADPLRWVGAFIRRWNALPGVTQHANAALSAPNYVELRKRLCDSGWNWKDAFLKFPLAFPEGKSPNLTFFLKWDSVSKILDNTYELKRTESTGLFGRNQPSDATRVRTGETAAYVAAAFAAASAASGTRSEG